MSSLDTTIRDPEETPAIARSVQGGTFALFVLAAMHFVVDAVASQVTPLWPTLKEHYQVPTFWMLFVWTIASSFSQLGFALIGDRAASRWLVWLGPAVGCVCLGCLGLFNQFAVLGCLLAIAGMGIAAFHPEGATLSGNCWPNARSRAVSIFAMGGFLGQSVGPPCSGWIVDHYGLRAALGRNRDWAGTDDRDAAGLSTRDSGHARSSSRDHWHLDGVEEASVPDAVAAVGRNRASHRGGRSPGHAGLLVEVAEVLRCGNWLGAIGVSGGIGLGGLLCAIVVRPRTERLALWFVPLLSVPCLLAMPSLQGLWLSAAALATGLLLGIAQPVFISYGQQLLPETQRVASSITMGLSWGTGGAISAALIDHCDRRQSFDIAFVAFAVAVVMSSVLCLLLPKMRAN